MGEAKVAITVTGTLDVKPLTDKMRELGKATSRTAMRRSLTKGRNTLQTTARKETQKSLNLTASGFKKATRTRTTLSDLSAQVDIQGRPIPLISFKGTRQTKSGVSIQPKPGGKRSILKHAFIAKVPLRGVVGDVGVHRGVFERALNYKKPRTRENQWHGLSIREIKGTHVVGALNKQRTRRRILVAGQAAFQKELVRQVDLALK